MGIYCYLSLSTPSAKSANVSESLTYATSNSAITVISVKEQNSSDRFDIAAGDGASASVNPGGSGTGEGGSDGIVRGPAEYTALPDTPS